MAGPSCGSISSGASRYPRDRQDPTRLQPTGLRGYPTPESSYGVVMKSPVLLLAFAALVAPLSAQRTVPTTGQWLALPVPSTTVPRHWEALARGSDPAAGPGTRLAPVFGVGSYPAHGLQERHCGCRIADFGLNCPF